MQIFLILLSLSYLVIEIVFNINFVNIVHEDKMYLYGSLDQWGRHVSSVGATIVLLRVFIIAKAPKIVTPFLLIIFYISFFAGQELLLDYITEKTPIEDKKNQSNAFLVKKGVINGVTSVSGLRPHYNKDEADNKVFLSSLGFLGFGYPDYLPDISKDNSLLYSQILYRDMELNTGFHFAQFSESRRLRREIYRRYETQYSNLDSKGYSESQKAWKEKESNEKLFIDNFWKVRHKYNKEKERLYDTHIKELLSNLMWVVSCDDLKCSNTFNKKLKAINLLNAKKYNLKSVYPENICRKNGENGWTFRHINEDRDKTHNGKANNANTKSYNGHSCVFDSRAMTNVIYQEMDSRYIEEFGTANFEFSNVDAFISSGELTRAIKTKVKNDYDIHLPSYWQRNDEKTFRNAIEKEFARNGAKIVQKEIAKKTGYDLPPNLYYDDFFKDKKVLNMLKNELGFFYTGKLDPYKIDNNEKFIKYFKSRYQKDSGKYYQTELKNNNAFIDETFKQTILPVLSISLSLTFGLINFGFIVAGTLALIKPIKKHEHKISSFIVLCGFIIPFFFNNHYVDQENFTMLFESFKNQNIIFAYYYKWFLNMETLVITHLGDIVMRFEFVDHMLQRKISFNLADYKSMFNFVW